jgi:hypothetical protein
MVPTPAQRAHARLITHRDRRFMLLPPMIVKQAASHAVEVALP